MSLALSEHVQLHDQQEDQNGRHHDVRHVFAQQKLQLQVLGVLLHSGGVFRQVFAQLAELGQVLVSVEQHFEALGHYVFDVHQLLIQLRNVFLCAGVAVLFSLLADYALELQELVRAVDALDVAQVVDTARRAIGCLQLLLEAASDVLEVEEAELLGVFVFGQDEVNYASLDHVVEAVVLYLHGRLDRVFHIQVLLRRQLLKQVSGVLLEQLGLAVGDGVV